MRILIASIAFCLCLSSFAGTMYWKTDDSINYGFANHCSFNKEKCQLNPQMFLNLTRRVECYELMFLLEMMCDEHDFTHWTIVDRWGKEHEIDWNMEKNGYN